MPSYGRTAVITTCVNDSCNTEKDVRALYGGYFVLECPTCGNIAFSVNEERGGVTFYSQGNVIRGNRHIQCLKCTWKTIDGDAGMLCPKCGKSDDWQTCAFNPGIVN